MMIIKRTCKTLDTCEKAKDFSLQEMFRILFQTDLLTNYHISGVFVFAYIEVWVHFCQIYMLEHRSIVDLSLGCRQGD